MNHIRRVRLRNFRCFEDVTLHLGKITLVTGANSSGKSSLLAGILSALQSTSFPFQLTLNGDFVNLGDYRELVYNHQRNREIGFEVEGVGYPDSPFDFTAEYRLDSTNGMPRLAKLRFSGQGLTLNVQERRASYRLHYVYDQSEDATRDFTERQHVQELHAALSRLFESFAEDPKSQVKNPFVGWDAELTEGRFSIPDITALLPSHSNSAGLPYRLVAKIRDVTQVLAMLRMAFNYIGAFRIAPQRTYYQSARPDLKVGIYGENYIDQIAEWEDRKAKPLRDLKRFAKRVGLIQEVRTSRMSGGRFDVVVRTGPASVKASLMDVGFGVSQFLPILVADLQLPPESTLMISQPEIHLHPSIQAATAEYFVDQSRRNEKRYIIETHSEYLINRFRLLIARKKIRPEDVRVVFLSSDAKLHEILLTPDGRIEGAPDEFFNTYMMDVMNLALEV